MKPCFPVLLLLTAGAAFAQDPPSRVARLNRIEGSVSFQPAGLDTWTSATPNYPLTTGDHLYTDAGSHAEMHVGPNAMRMSQQSNLGFLNLDDRIIQVRFTEGAMEVRLRRLDDDDLYEIDTPQGAISLLRTGDYRIDTDPDRNATMVTVWSGEVEVTANGTSFAVRPRETAYFAGDRPPDIRGLNQPDDFDRYVASLNQREDRVPPPVHVPPTMAGYEDLDANGVWRNDPGYGWVWTPRVEAGWAPYRNGHWAWVEPWGWTWIDDAPWGFAPFHYGRWATVGGVWVWAPGAVVARPVYAPAMVAFVGGPRFSAGIGFGAGVAAVAWFPLGPREPYYPAYHVSPTYIRQVNITHVTNINVTNVNVTNVRYVNQQVPGAVTAVPQNAFVGSRPVAAVFRPVSQQQLAEGQITGHAPQVAPQRESLLANERAGAAVPRPRQEVMTRPVVAKATPPPAPVNFQARQQMLQQNQGRPLDAQEVNQVRQQQPAAIVNRPPVRAASAPIPAVTAPAQPRFDRAPVSQPNLSQPNRPDRVASPLDSRPPNARPPNQPSPVPAPQMSRPEPAARPVPEARPAPESRQATEPRRENNTQQIRPRTEREREDKKKRDEKDKKQ